MYGGILELAGKAEARIGAIVSGLASQLFVSMEQHDLKKRKQLLEYQKNPELRDIWWSKPSSIFNCCTFFQQLVLIRRLWQLKTVVFLHSCLLHTLLLVIGFM